VGSGIRSIFELASLISVVLASPRGPDNPKIEMEPKMRIAVGILFLIGLFGPSGGQENLPANGVAPPSVGLEIGQRAPAFALADQFGHEQSNQTLNGSKGTVLLFFRSADW
jgi:hypothetical protein